MTDGYVPRHSRGNVWFERTDAHGETCWISMEELESLAHSPEFFNEDSPVSAQVVCSPDGWEVLYDEDRFEPIQGLDDFLCLPDDMLYHSAQREWFWKQNAQVDITTVIRSIDGDPVGLRIVTRGRPTISRRYLSRAFDKAMKKPSRRQLSRGVESIADPYEIDAATYYLAMLTDTKFGSIARTVDARHPSERRADGQLVDDVAEFLTRAGILGGSDLSEAA